MGGSYIMKWYWLYLIYLTHPAMLRWPTSLSLRDKEVMESSGSIFIEPICYYACFKAAIAASGSDDENTELPATRTLAPASTSLAALFISTPPSTSINNSVL
jgi:hypothetical protein